MPEVDNPLSLRSLTIGVDTEGCLSGDLQECRRHLFNEALPRILDLKSTLEELESRNGFRILSHRLTLTPISSARRQPGKLPANYYGELARTLDELAFAAKADFIAGFGVFLEKRLSAADHEILEALPQALHGTKRLCGFVNAASFSAGLNMDGVIAASDVLKRISSLGGQRALEAFARFAITANPEANSPYMPVSFHESREGNFALSIGIGGIDVLNNLLETTHNFEALSVDEVFELIKECVRELSEKAEEIGFMIASEAGMAFSRIDVSLVPMPTGREHSILALFKKIGVSEIETPGSLAILAMVNQAIKQGGRLGSSLVKGYSGALLSVSEDSIIFDAMKIRGLSLDRLLALTSVCAVGVDMVSLPASVPRDTLAGLIADELTIANACGKTASVRLILADGDAGDEIRLRSHPFLGKTFVADIDRSFNSTFIARGGHIPSPRQDSEEESKGNR